MKPGDKVQWATCKRRNGSMQFSQLEGILLEIDGNEALVKKQNGHFQRLPMYRLRLASEEGHLTQFVNAWAESIK